MSFPGYSADIEAEITFVPTDKGGRKTAAFSGYRPQFHYNGVSWDAVHEYPDVECVAPGENVRTLLMFLSPDAHFGQIHAGMPFEIREGSRVVGTGVITKILHLEESALRARDKK